MSNQRLYVDGAPCTNGCGRPYRQGCHTTRGRCSLCHSRERQSRRSHRATKPERHPNTVLLWELRREMDAEGKSGQCIYRNAARFSVMTLKEEKTSTGYNVKTERGDVVGRLERGKGPDSKKWIVFVHVNLTSTIPRARSKEI